MNIGSTDSIPKFEPLPPDELEALRAKLGITDLVNSLPDEPEEPEAPPIKRKRGRPRKYYRDQFNRPLKDQPIEEPETLSTLPSPIPTGRDARELSQRFQQLLIGFSQIGAALDPAILMTDKEAENISKPLTTYLVRTEATSKLAHRVLDEYDLAAFVVASLAYIVRVAKDMRNERSSIEQEQPKLESRRAPTSGRAVESENQQAVVDNAESNENGQEGPIDREWASTLTKLRNPTEV